MKTTLCSIKIVAIALISIFISLNVSAEPIKNNSKLVGELDFHTQQILNNYSPIPSVTNFTKWSSNISAKLKEVCNGYSELVANTGYLNSKYSMEKTDCLDAIHSQNLYLLSLKDNNVDGLKEEWVRMQGIRGRVKNYMLQYKQTPEYKAEVNKYLVN